MTPHELLNLGGIRTWEAKIKGHVRMEITFGKEMQKNKRSLRTWVIFGQGKVNYKGSVRARVTLGQEMAKE